MDHVLPPELLREVFEFGFYAEDQYVRSRLLVVARCVHKWLEPLLYRSIVFVCAEHVIASNRLTTFLSACEHRSDPERFLERSVRRVAFYNIRHQQEELVLLLQLLLGITDLTFISTFVNKEVAEAASRLPLQSLCCVNLGRGGLKVWNDVDGGARFPLLTHLHFHMSMFSIEFSSVLSFLTRHLGITHLTVSYVAEGSVKQMLSLDDKCPRIQDLLEDVSRRSVVNTSMVATPGQQAAYMYGNGDDQRAAYAHYHFLLQDCVARFEGKAGGDAIMMEVAPSLGW